MTDGDKVIVYFKLNRTDDWYEIGTITMTFYDDTNRLDYSLQFGDDEIDIASSQDDLIEMCERNQVSFLDPEPPTCETCEYWDSIKWNCYNHNLSVNHVSVKTRLYPAPSFGCIFHEPKESEG